MKNLLALMVLLAITLELPSALFAQVTDPAAVVTGSTEAFQAGNYESALDYYADEAVYKILMPGAPEQTYTGQAAIRAWWQELVAQHFELQVEVLNVTGDTVTTRTQTWVDFTRNLGIAPLVATEVYVVRDSKIISVTWTPTEETAAKLQAAMASLPETGGQPILGYMSLMVLGGLVLLGGLGLGLLRRHR